MDFRAVIILLPLCGTANAQDLLPTLDPQALGGSVFTLAALVAFIVQFVKKQFERQGRVLRWYVTLLVALGVSESLSALLFYSGYGATFGSAPPPWTWLIFGVVAAAAGAGGRDLLMSFAERGRPAASPAQDVNVKVEAPAPAAPVDPRMTVVIERPGDVPGLDDAPLVR